MPDPYGQLTRYAKSYRHAVYHPAIPVCRSPVCPGWGFTCRGSPMPPIALLQAPPTLPLFCLQLSVGLERASETTGSPYCSAHLLTHLTRKRSLTRFITSETDKPSLHGYSITASTHSSQKKNPQKRSHVVLPWCCTAGFATSIGARLT